MAGLLNVLTDLGNPIALKVVIPPTSKLEAAGQLEDSSGYNVVAVSNIVDARDPGDPAVRSALEALAAGQQVTNSSLGSIAAASSAIAPNVQELAEGQQLTNARLGAIQDFEPGNSFLSSINSHLAEVIQPPGEAGVGWVRIGGITSDGAVTTLPVGTIGWLPNGALSIETVNRGGRTYGLSSTMIVGPNDDVDFTPSDGVTYHVITGRKAIIGDHQVNQLCIQSDEG